MRYILCSSLHIKELEKNVWTIHFFEEENFLDMIGCIITSKLGKNMSQTLDRLLEVNIPHETTHGVRLYASNKDDIIMTCTKSSDNMFYSIDFFDNTLMPLNKKITINPSTVSVVLQSKSKYDVCLYSKENTDTNNIFVNIKNSINMLLNETG